LEEVKSDITAYIPQRPPMVMIDELVQAENVLATTTFKILNENIFTHKGRLTESGLIENMAQTAAALVGYQCRLNNTSVPLGFIAAIKNWKLSTLPKVGSIIETTVRVVNNVLDVTIVEGNVSQDDLQICSCELRILVQRNSEIRY
jgi:3-hydroxyacyl-[acyl-carrier-protein] dehydratase